MERRVLLVWSLLIIAMLVSSLTSTGFAITVKAEMIVALDGHDDTWGPWNQPSPHPHPGGLYSPTCYDYPCSCDYRPSCHPDLPDLRGQWWAPCNPLGSTAKAASLRSGSVFMQTAWGLTSKPGNGSIWDNTWCADRFVMEWSIGNATLAAQAQMVKASVNIKVGGTPYEDRGELRVYFYTGQPTNPAEYAATTSRMPGGPPATVTLSSPQTKPASWTQADLTNNDMWVEAWGIVHTDYDTGILQVRWLKLTFYNP